MRRIPLWLPVLSATLVLLALGSWQMQRLAWKEALIAEREAGLAAAPATLPAELDGAEAKALEFHRVSLKGVFDHEKEQLFGARARSNVLGYQLLTPLLREDGSAVLVDRGWVPAERADPASRPASLIEGEVEIGGIARYRADDRPGLFTPDNDPEARHWYHYDIGAMARALDLELAPLVVEADADAAGSTGDTARAASGGLPLAGPEQAQIANNHLQYAITWYGLAAGLIAVYIVFRQQQRRRGADGPPPPKG